MARKKKDAAEEVKKSAAQEVVEQINKMYKREVLSTADKKPPIRQIPLMNPEFDRITQGGVLVNRINEFLGANGSLKTYHAILAVVAFQKEFPDMDAAFVDVEGTLDTVLCKKLGVDLSRMLYMQPESLEQAVDTAQILLANDKISLVVFDSMHAVGSAAETEKSMEDDQMAVNARFWNKATRKFQASLNMNTGKDTTLVVINSVYSKVGFVMGNPEEIKNGNQMKYAKSLSVNFVPLKELPGKDPVTNEDCTIGRHIKMKVLKNKAGRPFLKSDFFFSFIPHNGLPPATFDFVDQIVRIAIRLGFVEQAGAWIKYNGDKIQGIDNFVETAREDVNLQEELTDAVYTHITTKDV